MKWLYLSAAALLSVALAGAQTVTGRWTGNFSTADNGLEIVVALNQAADGAVTGYILSPRSTDTITSGKIEGNNVTLEAERAGRGGAIQKVTYTATVEGGKMKLTVPAPNFGGQGRGRPRRALPERRPRRTSSRRGPRTSPVDPAADAAASPRSSNWPASPPTCPRRFRPVPSRSPCPCPPPPSSTTAWPRPRPWAGIAGTSSATRSATRWSARWPTPSSGPACATPATSTSTSTTPGKPPPATPPATSPPTTNSPT